MLPDRVKDRVEAPLRTIDEKLLTTGDRKLGEVKDFHSLSALAQEHGKPIAQLVGIANSGHNQDISAVTAQFDELARRILKKMENGT
jgi:hypothetical protein